VKLEGRELVPLPRDRAWAAINDPQLVCRATPGMESLEEVAPDRYSAVIELALPAINGRFEGSMEFVERSAPDRLKLRFEGRGGPGFVNGEAALELADAEGGTEFRYTADVRVGGAVARLGQRMISGVSQEMAGQFFEELGRQGAVGASESPAGTAALPVRPSPLVAALRLAWRSLLRILGLSRR